ncbi:outer membrane beta-barrel protein [Bernardetia sp. MNP-M8]|uniref:outer membrane beta-barrel protein n=1 Tax=Bernardetia sp. MNP-M8 TaxID=3127470 RepID=UPI0030CC0776
MKSIFSFPIFILSCFFILSFSNFAFAQNYNLQGIVLEKETSEPLISANIVMRFASDTSKFVFATTDFEGKFSFKNLTQQNYILQISYVGYQNYSQNIILSKPSTVLEPILIEESTLLAVTVEGRQTISEQIGDTTQYNASAFKTEKNADAETLLKKMPTITTENGQIQAQGEAVGKVLVDGKEFFGNDANLALKSLPAEIIEKIQVFDQESDQARFSGVSDGNTVKTINIVTKKDSRNGQFGKIYAGYGTDERYFAGGNINFFNGKQRISVIGITNNVSQQNFSTQDLLGVVGSTGNTRGRGRRNRGNPSDVNNFLVGGQNGITKTSSIGINYSDEWGKKIQLSGSYFFNWSDNSATTNLTRDFFLQDDANGAAQNQFYNENQISGSDNQNHRFALRFEYKIDSVNELILTPRLNIQNYKSNSLTDAQTLLDDDFLLNRTVNNFNNNSTAFNFENDALFRHRFKKRGRTLSVKLNTQANLQDGQNSLLANVETLKSSDTLNQETFNTKNDILWATEVEYTESLSEKSSLQIEYEYSNNQIENETETFDIFSELNQGRILNNQLSSTIESDYLYHKAGLGYSYRTKKLNINTSFNYQNATLNGGQTFPFETNFKRNFQNILPRVVIRYEISDNSNLRLIYRSSTRNPQITQLQEVLDNSNPLQLSIGNEDLNQQVENRYIARYSYNNPDKRINFFTFAYLRQTNDYITNSTWIAQQDSVTVEGVLLNEGVQLTRPVNVDGYLTGRLNAMIGIPFWKLNFNLNNQFGYNRIPTVINGEKNIANNYSFTEGLTISSNINEKIDFGITYNLGYNIVENTIQPQADNNYLTHTLEFRNLFLFKKGFLWQNDLTYQSYNGLSDSFNQDYLLWSMSVGKRFMKDERAELKLTVFDLLNQNNSISRNVTETYVEDIQTQVLNRYFMVSFTYMIRNFKTAKAKEMEQEKRGRGKGRN